MKVREIIEALQKLEVDESEVLIALPGNRFSPASLVEPYGKVDDKGKAVTVALIYPHPRDVASMGATPSTEQMPVKRSDFVESIDSVLDFFKTMGGDDEEVK